MYNISMVLSQINILQSSEFFNTAKSTVLDIIMSLSNLSTDYCRIFENTLE